ncbi:MAG: DUF424 family protein [Candidatus Marsarchaeota archaeon]|jgi:hypothetical protein|nr:DUF424 family protein [Candidatus Marsarchaeota archaeon]
MIYLKLHETNEGRILAMCDESLIDRVLEEGDAYVDIKGYADFYKGSLVGAKEFSELETAGISSANIVGEESVGLAIGRELIKEENVKKIKGVPYAHAYWFGKPGQS